MLHTCVRCTFLLPLLFKTNVLHTSSHSDVFSCRHGLNEMQKRHVPRGGNPHGGAAASGGRGTSFCFNALFLFFFQGTV